MPFLRRAPSEPTLTPDQAAAAWLARLRSDKLTERDRRQFAAWRSDPVHDAAFTRLEHIWGTADQVAARPEVLHVREAALAAFAQARPPRRLLPMALAAGLTLAAVGLSVSGVDVDRAIHDGIYLLSRYLAGGEEFTTSVGERSTIPLTDGSVVTLDTDSAAMVDYSNRERAIKLVRGQALFAVAKGDKRPFIVNAGSRKIIATGTEFDVRLAGAMMEVTLVEGHVVVDRAITSPGASLAADDRIELEPGERLIANPDRSVSVTTGDIARTTSWATGKLIFSGTRLGDAVAEINRYAMTHIHLSDDKMAELRVNGVFRTTGQPGDFIKGLIQIYPVVVDSQPAGEIRIVWKPQN